MFKLSNSPYTVSYIVEVLQSSGFSLSSITSKKEKDFQHAIYIITFLSPTAAPLVFDTLSIIKWARMIIATIIISTVAIATFIVILRTEVTAEEASIFVGFRATEILSS